MKIKLYTRKKQVESYSISCVLKDLMLVSSIICYAYLCYAVFWSLLGYYILHIVLLLYIQPVVHVNSSALDYKVLRKVVEIMVRRFDKFITGSFLTFLSPVLVFFVILFYFLFYLYFQL